MPPVKKKVAKKKKKKVARKKPWRVEFTFLGEPLTKSNAYKLYKGKVRIPKRIQNYEASLKVYAIDYMRRKKKHITKSLVKVTITYYLGTKRVKDLQNLPKSSLDAFNNVIYVDDSQVHELKIKKKLDRKNPRIHVVVTKMTDKQWTLG